MQLSRAMRLGILLVFFWTVAAAAQSYGPPTISVTGDSEIRVVPDEVILNVGVQSTDKNLKVAKQANDAAIARAIAVGKRYGIPAKDLQTDYVSIEPRYRNYEVADDLLGYVVRKSLIVRLREIDKFEGLLTDLVDAGVNVVHGIEFRTTELRKHRDEARALAIKAAQEKASALAQQAGRSAGKVISISETGGGWWFPYNSWWGRPGMQMQNVTMDGRNDSSSAGESSLAPGQIQVTARVSVVVALE